MGRFIAETVIKVGFVGISDDTARSLAQRLTMTTATDPGEFQIARFASLKECKKAVEDRPPNAICLAIDAFPPDELTSFVSDLRVTQPLIAFCLIGKRSFLEELPGYHEAWKSRFSHYYKLESDLGDDDFSENAGLLRDLFLADAVKCRALGQYQTTPGAVIRLKAPRPYGFWLLVLVSLLAALVGGAVGPVMERVLPAKDEQQAIEAGKNDVSNQQR